MAKRILKVVKTESEDREQGSISRITSPEPKAPGGKARKRHASRFPPLTPAERAEAARFRALTTTKAAQQAKLRRMMAQLQDLDEISPAA
jgi:hypothetical protein